MTDKYKQEVDKVLEKIISKGEESSKRLMRNLIASQNRIYTQLESLSWLQHRLKIVGHLPPLRGWAASPDVLLKLHSHIMNKKPKVVVEFGSGASTIVIADALRQNGFGKLFSVENSLFYSEETLSNLRSESLTSWVDLRVGELQAWEGMHMNRLSNVKPSRWYPVSLLKDVECIDLVLVDGPPGDTCEFARYPALPVVFEKLSEGAQVWMDDTVRQEEIDICQYWSKNFDLTLEYLSLDKGLGVLSRQ